MTSIASWSPRKSERVLGVQRRVDAAGRRDGVRADRVHLAHDRDRRALVGGGQGGALAGEARADDQDVVCWHGTSTV
jgi:hypothetical protein